MSAPNSSVAQTAAELEGGCTERDRTTAEPDGQPSATPPPPSPAPAPAVAPCLAADTGSAVDPAALQPLEPLQGALDTLLRQTGDALSRLAQIAENQKLAADQLRRFGSKIEQVASGAASAPLRQLAEGMIFFRDLLAGMAASRDPDALGPASAVCQMLLTQLDQVLQASGLEQVPAEGAPDYQLHRAVQTVVARSAEQVGRIVGVHRAGFRLGDRLLRPTEVIVAVASPPPEPIETRGSPVAGAAEG